MRAVGYRQSLPIDAPEALVDIELPDPVATGRDLLVEVRAVSVNPVDTKVRRRAGPDEPGGVKVLGYDAAGMVRTAEPEATLFRPGDEVFYAGSIARQGTNAELHLVDERIIGLKPRSLDFAQAAALPLTSITAWEMLFDRLDVRRLVPGAASAILIIGGAGGVGSIAIQHARHLTDLVVIATASRPDPRRLLDPGPLGPARRGRRAHARPGDQSRRGCHRRVPGANRRDSCAPPGPLMDEGGQDMWDRVRALLSDEMEAAT